jgi:hypothetical protein
MSQLSQIRAHLQKGNTLTPIEALEKFGCFRLGARIHNLKERGWDIEKVWIEAKGKRFASYYLVKHFLDS